MPEVLTNRGLADRALPNDGPTHEPVPLVKFKNEVQANRACEALGKFPLRSMFGRGGRFVADGVWVCFRGDTHASSVAHQLAVLYLRGLLEDGK